MVIDEEIGLEWARIPHFYYNYYVYQYATGFSAATALSKQILEEGEPAVKRYIDFLRAGSSDYPIEVLKKAGVDMTSSDPIKDACKVFEEKLTELEQLLIITRRKGMAPILGCHPLLKSFKSFSVIHVERGK